jgi:hypothetical protein
MGNTVQTGEKILAAGKAALAAIEDEIAALPEVKSELEEEQATLEAERGRLAFEVHINKEVDLQPELDKVNEQLTEVETKIAGLAYGLLSLEDRKQKQLDDIQAKTEGRDLRLARKLARQDEAAVKQVDELLFKIEGLVMQIRERSSERKVIFDKYEWPIGENFIHLGWNQLRRLLSMHATMVLHRTCKLSLGHVSTAAKLWYSAHQAGLTSEEFQTQSQDAANLRAANLQADAEAAEAAKEQRQVEREALTEVREKERAEAQEEQGSSTWRCRWGWTHGPDVLCFHASTPDDYVERIEQGAAAGA